MATYGKTRTAGAQNSGSWPFTLWANMRAVQQGVMPTDGVVSAMWWYGHVFTPGSHIKGVIYEISGTIPNATIVAESESTDFDTDPGTSANYYWHEIPMSANLEAGKTYGLALIVAKEGSFAPYIIGETNNGLGHVINAKVATIDDAPNPFGLSANETFWMSFYIEYELPPDPATPSNLYAPVRELPILTSGRNASGYSSGHQPKYTLDNNPDTWWLADSTADHDLYYDLGIATAVDAVALWLHNYNEAYDADKAIQVSYSANDVTYTALTAQLLTDIRTTGHPIVLFIFENPHTARYWKISFKDFDVMPIHERAAVSGVWFVNPYPLPFKHQRPQIENVSYHNIVNVLPSKVRYASYRGLGQARIKERNYIFPQEAEQFENAQDAYRACRGNLLPCFMQCEFVDETYYALYWVSKLRRGEKSFDYFNTPIVFQDIPHNLVPLEAKGLYPLSGEGNLVETTGWWKFDLDRLDSSGNNLTLTAAVLDNTKYIRGVANTGKTAIPYDAYSALYLLNASATPIEVNVKSHWSIEFIFCSTDMTASQQAIISKWNATPTGWFVGLYAGKLFFRLSGSGDDVSGNSITTVSDGQWHYCAIVVDRANDEVKMYIDGELDQTIDITAFGGDSQNTENVVFGDVPDTYIDEIMLARGSAEFLTQADITERYLDLKKDYGTWGV